MTKYYVDTCIWRDYLENREDRFRPLGQWALDLFQLIQENNEIILYSDAVIDELRNKFSTIQINELFSSFEDCLLKVDISPTQVQEATLLDKIRKTGFADALHAVLARDNNAIIITRDEHFIDLTDIAQIKKPEDLL